MSDQQWREQIRYQYQVDHRLNIVVFMYRRDQNNKQPRYLLTDSEFCLDLSASLTKAIERLAQQKPSPHDPVVAPNVSLPAELYSVDGVLQWEIGVGGPMGVTCQVFQIGDRINDGHWFHFKGKDTALRGILSCNCVHEFLEDNTLIVWGRPKSFQKWVHLGRLERPGDKPVFRRQYRLSLDEKGVLRIHNGEPPYLLSSDYRCLRDLPAGWVYQAQLASAKRETDEDRNPFTGKH